ncbi:hypothetical protein PESP_a0487 [Pseudoalteromonas espejiana DSM 9414]|nr:hypothetical protein PESP_a0487 [Pseudoalteromonas espejiana DSM 9414]
MNIGGAERSLIGLLSSIDYEKCDVSLKLFHHEGDFLPLIPAPVKIIPNDPLYSNYERPLRKVLFSKYFRFGVARLIGKIECYIYRKRNKIPYSSWIAQQYTHKNIINKLPQIPGNYDMAINFLGVPDVVCKKVVAKIRLGWVHTDYEQLSVNEELDIRVYSELDYIINVSKDCNEIFKLKYPSLNHKAKVIENILSKKSIVKQSNLNVAMEDMPRVISEQIILSIGRYCRAKNFDNIPKIAKNLLEYGCRFKWYIIGYGSEEDIIRDNIDKLGLSDVVILLGKKANPYPYIKKCDIYVQPSRYEGKSVTVREAQILGKPVVITDYATAPSQINNGVDGIIVPMENTKCALQLSKIMSDKILLSKLAKYCDSADFGNEEEINTLYKLAGKVQ